LKKRDVKKGEEREGWGTVSLEKMKKRVRTWIDGKRTARSNTMRGRKITQPKLGAKDVEGGERQPLKSRV